MWIYFVTIVIRQLAWNLAIQFPYNDTRTYITASEWHNCCWLCSALHPFPIAVLILLTITLCLAKRRRNWFLIEPGTVNPYRLVYVVTKFARQHKTPVRRSAFTYCENEIPTGLDLGKEKYGGPFSTEQVEDVKVFYGILKVLFSFGVVFFLGFCSKFSLATICTHTQVGTLRLALPIILLCCNSVGHYQNISYAELWFALSSTDCNMSPSLPVFAPPLHIPICSRNAG